MSRIAVSGRAMRKPVVDVAFFLPKLNAGGAESAVVALANELASRGKNVSLVLGESRGPFLEKVSPTVRIESLREVGRIGKIRTIFRLASYLNQSGFSPHAPK